MGMRRFAGYVGAAAIAAAAGASRARGCTRRRAASRDQRAHARAGDPARADAQRARRDLRSQRRRRRCRGEKARAAFLPVLDRERQRHVPRRATSRRRDTANGLADVDPAADRAVGVPAVRPGQAVARRASARRRSTTSACSRSTRRTRSSRCCSPTRSCRPRSSKLDTAKANLADTDAQVKAQLVSSNDVTRAQIDLRRARARELEADQGSARRPRTSSSRSRSTRRSRAALVAPDRAARRRRSSRAAAAEPLVAHGLAHRARSRRRKQHAALAAHDFAREPHMRLFPTLGVGAPGKRVDDEPPATGHDVDGDASRCHASLDDLRRRRRATPTSTRATRRPRSPISTTDALAPHGRRAGAHRGRAARRRAAGAGRARKRRDGRRAQERRRDRDPLQAGAREGDRARRRERSRFPPRSTTPSAEFAVAPAYLALRQAIGLDPLGRSSDDTRHRRWSHSWCSRRVLARPQRSQAGGSARRGSKLEYPVEVAPLESAPGAVHGDRARHASTRSSRCRSPRASPAPSTR